MPYIKKILYNILNICYKIARMFVNKNKCKIDLQKAKNELNDFYLKDKNRRKTTKINLKDNPIDLSIIIPVYNSEKYIAEAIESILKQNINFSYEIVIIDDGSLDESLKEIRKYENMKEVKIISIKNQGVSYARNFGLGKALGKYIMFMDSDDKLEENSINILMNLIVNNNADITVGSFYKFNNQGNILYKNIIKNKTINNDEYEKYQIYGMPWGKVFKKELFNDIEFPVDYYYEDTIIINLVFNLAKKVITTEKIVYAYRDNFKGLTKIDSIDKKRLDAYFVVEYCHNIIKEKNIENESLFRFYLNIQLGSLLNQRIKKFPKNIQEDIFLLSSRIIDEMKEKYCENTVMEENMCNAFTSRNFKYWKLNCFFINIFNHLKY